MRWLALVVIVAVGVLVSRLLLNLGEARKRARESRATNVAELATRKLNRRLEIETVRPPTEAIAQIAGCVKADMNGRVALQTDSQVIAFSGSAARSKYHGMLQTPAEEMPLRIAAEAVAHGVGARVRLLIDEDYGFQMFLGMAKRAFAEKYAAAFDAAQERLRSQIESNT